MNQLNVFAVILAGGASSRMGTSKMALKWGDSTILETTLTHVEGGAISGTLLVTGGYRELIEPLPKVVETQKVHNSDFASGEMISSIKLAFEYIKQLGIKPNGVLVLPGDMPMVTSELIDQVIARWRESPDKIVAPVFESQRGHPVIFPFEVFCKFETLSSKASPRDLIKSHTHLLRLLSVDNPAVIIDVDTPAEYDKYRAENRK